MGTDVENVTSVSTKSQSSLSEAVSQPHSSSESPQQSNTTQTSTHPTFSTKKKKKRKNTTTPASAQPVGVTSSPSPASFPSSSMNASERASSSSASSVQPESDIPEQWQQRVQSLRASLSKAQKENQLLISDLAAAVARASDAEHAEDTVNKGLLTARTVISQRDRTIAELKSTSSNLQADLTHLQEEKKKTDKRLILLKTVSTNLQEAREARDAIEKKLEDANTEISLLQEKKLSLEKDVELLKQQVETMEMVKQQLARREIETEELSRSLHRVGEGVRRREVCSYAAGAISMLAIDIIWRMLVRSREADKE